MSRFKKLLLLSTSLSGIVFLFNCSYPFSTKKSIDEQELIQFILKEYSYEIAFGDENVDVNKFVDETLTEVLKQNKN